MKKKYLSVMVAGVMAFAVFAGCSDNKKPSTSDPENPNPPTEDVYVPSNREETEPIVFGIDGADGVFSPFFATASYDSEIAGHTQLGMLTSEGTEIKYGDDYACIVKDMKTTYLNSSNQAQTTATGAAYTQYDFLIKNTIKFSDGEPLTIDDVLFNLYVYLDPAYTGSSTIYSTDIVGLSEYRTQSDDENADQVAEQKATQRADERLTRIYNWLNNQYILELNDGVVPTEPVGGLTYITGLDEYEDEINQDIEFFLNEYSTEVSNGYESAVSGFDEIRKSYMFDKDCPWEYYLYTYGIVTPELVPGSSGRTQTKLVKMDEDGNYIDAPAGAVEDPNNEVVEDRVYKVYVFDFSTDGDKQSTNGWVINALNEYLEKNCDADATEAEIEAATREWAIDLVYSSTVGTRAADGTIQKYEYSSFANTIIGSESTNTLYTNILADERAKVILESAGEKVKTISGITTSKVTSFTNDENETYDLDGEYDVLTIKINKIDPKAIWNFAFTVAPLHYYAPAEESAKYVTDDNFLTNGVVYGSTDWMNDVLKKTERLRVPVGAGPYKASKLGGLESGETYPDSSEFWANRARMYYERNTYFDLVDGVVGGTIQNAKIKFMQYTKVNSNTILDSLSNEEIDVGTPNATNDNVNKMNSLTNLTYQMNKTNGYGYMGINAGKSSVSDVWLRRAIFKAMDITIIINGYYSNGLGIPLYRPMSTESWAYPKGEDAQMPFKGTVEDDQSKTGTYDVDYIYDDSGNDIRTMLEDHGYTFDGSGKVLTNPDGVKPEKITFTVAGETTDHPAWSVFKNAEEILEGKLGFEIDVKTDQFALNKLSSGGLEVWAAAWSSTTDPDMYQVYHMDSQASSTLNWGYRDIKADKTKYVYEYNVISELSELIDQARSVLEQAPRAEIYAECLDLVMELAVEMPLYQRNDMTVYNKTKIDGKTLNQKPTAYDGLFSKIWEVGYVD